MAIDKAPDFKGTFTDVYLKALRAWVCKNPPDKEYDLRERHGFGIRIRKSGVITFFYMYHFCGKRRFLNLGPYSPPPDIFPPNISLSDARKKFTTAFSMVADGLDPLTPPPEPPPEPEEVTVSNLKSEYIKEISTTLVPRSVKHRDQNLEKYLIPLWGNRSVKNISRSEAIKLIKEIASTKPGSARNVMLAARAMFEYALDMEYVDINPFRKIGRAVPQAAANSVNRTLNHDEIRTLWKELTDGYGSSAVRRILKLVLILGQRPGEVAAMKYEHIDGDWWTIPKENIKIGKNPNIDEKKKFDQCVFLPALAKDLIGNGIGYVFTPRGTPITENALSGHVRREVITKDGKVRKKRFYGLTDWTPHDLRRTMSTQLAEELDADHRHIDAILGHIIPGVLGVYVRTKYGKKKQELGLAWEKRLLEIISHKSAEDQSEPFDIGVNRRILTNEEIKIIWHRLALLKSKHSGRALQLVLVTGQQVTTCASCHSGEIISDTSGKWWQIEKSNRIFLTQTAQKIIGDPTNYAFSPRGNNHINIASLSYNILNQDCFGLPKWTPEDLRYTTAAKICELGGPSWIIDAIEQGTPTNPWELRHWLERWEQTLLSIV